MTRPLNDPSRISQARLKEILRYDPDAGIFTWCVDRFTGNNHNRPNVRAGDPAGCVTKYGNVSYVQIRIDGKCYFGHRLAWFYVYGVWPNLLDHRDGVGTNNRLSNLRECSRSQNAKNVTASARNTSGCPGVSWDKSSNGWAVYLTHEGKRRYYGNYQDFEEAKRVRLRAEREINGEFVRAA